MNQELRLVRLYIRNFKGVKEFTLDARGYNARVFGDNATGKTTLFDGFVWLLFDKDSQNKKDFSIKTLVGGKEVHNLEHEVEAIFLLDGKEITLRKVFAEKWTKKRSSATSEFSGHTTNYFVNGVPSKKKEYMDEVASIIQEDVFKLLTSPSFFNEQLKWQERRKTLLEICGDISEEEVIASDSSLASLPAILQGRSIENHRKVIASRRAEINKELDKIPVRIDEITRSLPSVDGLDKGGLEVQVTAINGEIDDKLTLISNIRNGSAIVAKQQEIQQIDMDLINIKQQHESGTKEQMYQLETRIQEEKSNINIINSKLDNTKNQKRSNDESITRIEDVLVRLRSEWTEVNNQEFVHTDACECPTCGQSLPDEQVATAKDKAMAQFNLNKSNKLEEINATGKRESSVKKGLQEKNESLTKEYEKLNSQISERQNELQKHQERLSSLKATVIDITENPQYVAKLNEKQQINEEINNLRNMAEQSVQDVQFEIVELKSRRDQLQNQVGLFTVVNQSQVRISELEEQEKSLAEEYEKLEHELFLTEEFIRTKVNLLEKKINSRFKYARFKLFEQQINGGLTEVCETLYEGVPYSTGLNNAAKINVGLDIINTLSDHYGFLAPIFVDNSEAVTKLIDTNSQLISLVVSEKDKQLRVETLSKEMKEAI